MTWLMNSLAEAVEYFKSLGFISHEREWSLGKTILVATSSERNQATQITVLKNAIYIAPEEDLWSIYDFENLQVVPISGFKTLEEVVIAAENYLKKRLETKSEAP